jgi:methionine synthase I (cobalamin-dependent)
MNRSSELLAYLSSGKVLLADGATGTMLQAAGLPLGTPPERWNLDQPKKIAALYRAYLDAGSQIILTNSFGGSRLKLKRAGAAEITIEANRAAATLARDAAGERAFIAGDIGPSGELLEPYGDLIYQDAVDAFAEQAAALASGGVDCLWIETMMSLDEAKAAIEGAKRAAPQLPLFCTLSFGPAGKTMMGVTPEQVIERLCPLGLAACGGNCGQGPEQMVATICHMATHVGAGLRPAPATTPTLIAKPNAGLPRLVGDKQTYDMTPEDMARHMLECIRVGARIVGGCCGSTPAHIRAMARALSAQ